MGSAKILVVEDDQDLLEALCATLSTSGFDAIAAQGGPQALACLQENDVQLVVTDVQMQPLDGHLLMRQIRDKYPELPVVLMTAYGTIERAVAAMRDGAVDYLVKPFDANVLLELVNRYALHRVADDELVAVDPASRETLELARRVAATEATVMICGESGTGKEVFARFIHKNSPRAAGPFVAINCAAIPENMLEAVLFGYEKGAFTGAYQATPGKFEQAQDGTLLLDEISEMDLGLQAKLLRVLQEREVERLGGRRTIALNVRVLATTNRNLHEEVAAGRFREDLYYRLNVFPLRLRPLRERRDDILPLVDSIVRKHCRGSGSRPALTEEARSALIGYRWPGNVRELDNVVQRALILKRNDFITREDLHFEAPAGTEECPDEGGESLGDGLKQRENRLILEALKESNGSRKAAAEKLGISQRTLRYKLARMRDDGIAIPG